MRTHLALFCTCLFAWLGLSAPAYAQDSFDHVVVILDTSCSMETSMSTSSQSKMAAAQEALKVVLQTLPQETRIGLLTFEDDWAYPLSARDDSALEGAIARTTPSGGTPLGVFIKRGADALLEAREAQYGYGSYRLLVVTDGQASDAQKMLRFAPEVVDRGITMDVIGVAMDEDHALKQLANSYRRADDPETLVQAVQAVLAEVSADTQDAAGGDVFQELDGLPDAFALALLQNLGANSGNHPIGTTVVTKEDGKTEIVPSVVTDSNASDCSTGPGPLGSIAPLALLLPLFLRRRAAA